MPTTLPIWRHSQVHASANESASASGGGNHTLATLEVSSSDPGLARFALTEQEHDDSWRWVIFNIKGTALATGSEPTQALAKSVAEQALAWNRTRDPFYV